LTPRGAETLKLISMKLEIYDCLGPHPECEKYKISKTEVSQKGHYLDHATYFWISQIFQYLCNDRRQRLQIQHAYFLRRLQFANVKLCQMGRNVSHVRDLPLNFGMAAGVVVRGGSNGGPAPLFLAKSILFFTLYTMKYMTVWDHTPNVEVGGVALHGQSGQIGCLSCLWVSLLSFLESIHLQFLLSVMSWWIRAVRQIGFWFLLSDALQSCTFRVHVLVLCCYLCIFRYSCLRWQRFCGWSLFDLWNLDHAHAYFCDTFCSSEYF